MGLGSVGSRAAALLYIPHVVAPAALRLEIGEIGVVTVRLAEGNAPVTCQAMLRLAAAGTPGRVHRAEPPRDAVVELGAVQADEQALVQPVAVAIDANLAEGGAGHAPAGAGLPRGVGGPAVW